MNNEEPVKKDSPFWQEFLRNIWLLFHEPDLKITEVSNWSTWAHKVGDGR